jgi:hypothetical protein
MSKMIDMFKWLKKQDDNTDRTFIVLNFIKKAWNKNHRSPVKLTYHGIAECLMNVINDNDRTVVIEHRKKNGIPAGEMKTASFKYLAPELAMVITNELQRKGKITVNRIKSDMYFDYIPDIDEL